MTLPQTPSSPRSVARDGEGTNPSGTVLRAAGGSAAERGLGEDPCSAAGPVLDIHVVGIPAPQGSKRGYVVNGRAVIVDDNKPRLRDWRSDVKNATLDAIGRRDSAGTPFAMLAGAVDVDITFLMPRPKSHYRTGRNAHLLRDNAPRRPATKPDVDKLLRGCLDAMKSASVYGDDAQVVTLTGRKHYATHHAGAVIHIYVAA